MRGLDLRVTSLQSLNPRSPNVRAHYCIWGASAVSKNDKGNLTKASVSDRLDDIKDDNDGDDEKKALMHCLELIEAEAVAAQAEKEAKAALDAKVLNQYSKLSEAEIKTLVVDDKWFVSTSVAIDGEVQRLTQALAGRVKELEERYARTLPQLEDDVDQLNIKVGGHLKQMGLVLI